MLNLMDVIRRALRADPILQAAVGEDSDGEYKIYTTLGKTGVTPPYVVLQLVPDVGPSPLYGEAEGLESFGIMATSWAENPTEAWQLADFVDDAIERADFDFTPHDLMLVRRDQSPQELPDRDTNWRQVVVPYRFLIGR